MSPDPETSSGSEFAHLNNCFHAFFSRQTKNLPLTVTDKLDDQALPLAGFKSRITAIPVFGGMQIRFCNIVWFCDMEKKIYTYLTVANVNTYTI
jgi:hypothetical protein